VKDINRLVTRELFQQPNCLLSNNTHLMLICLRDGFVCLVQVHVDCSYMRLLFLQLTLMARGENAGIKSL
jgi:hypothetical protein